MIKPRYIFIFCLIALFFATFSAAKSLSTVDKFGPVAFSKTQKPLLAYKQTLQSAIDWLLIFLESIDKREDLELEAKQLKAIEFIRHIRWGPEQKNYFWIIDLEGNMILEPLYPRSEGKNYLMAKDRNNKKIFVEFIITSRNKGLGFVAHHGLGYDKNISNPRISLVRLFKIWGWVIGTGVDLVPVKTAEVAEAAETSKVAEAAKAAEAEEAEEDEVAEVAEEAEEDEVAEVDEEAEEDEVAEVDEEDEVTEEPDIVFAPIDEEFPNDETPASPV